MSARHRNDGLRKRCDCARRAWPGCPHPWWINFKWKNEHHRYSLDKLLDKHVKDKTDAKAHAERIRLQIREGTFRGPRAAADTPALDRLTLHELFAEYRQGYLLKRRALAQLKAGDYQIALIEKTVLRRTDDVAIAFGAWFARDITADTLEQFAEVRRARGHIAANRDLGVLRAAFNWAVGRGLVERTPFLRGTTAVVKLAREDARTRRLEPGEAERLLTACTDRLRAIVEAALETGCRRGELLTLQWSQVQWTPKAQIFLPAAKTKTRTDRYVPISARLRPLLEIRYAMQEAAREGLQDRSVPPTG
jgi:integrase